MIERTFSSAEHVAEVRFWVAEFCTKAEVSQATVEDTVLVASELVTNTLRHTRSGEEGGHYTVRVRRGSSRVLLEVSDQGAATFPMVRRSDIDSPLPADRGHGLRLVDACAYRWWVRGDEHGRTVFADVGPAPAPNPHRTRTPGPRAGV